ncbi:hypothetical protein M9H77_02240 [Catharanthus roseus]|uniref:Uncharacterized protein n=1 Tax=Catharanthus roseus TaxID=4058 RepID=A0ACC0C8B5_CATRO|nr:hypothetical protein M9H77_02240 [Catharanthus roseus]
MTSLKEEQEKEKQNEIEKSEETKEEMSLMIFEGDKREEMKESRCDISLPLNSLSTGGVNLFTNSNNHFLACFSPSMQKFEAQNMENEGSLAYKLYKTISFLLSTSFLIQPQFLNFLTTTCGTKLNHGMKAKEEGMGKELSFEFLDELISLLYRKEELSGLSPLKKMEYQNHTLSLVEKTMTEFVKFILFKDHDAIDTIT